MTERVIILHHWRLTNRVHCPKLTKAIGKTAAVKVEDCAACPDNLAVGRLKVTCAYGTCRKAKS